MGESQPSYSGALLSLSHHNIDYNEWQNIETPTYTSTKTCGVGRVKKVGGTTTGKAPLAEKTSNLSQADRPDSVVVTEITLLIAARQEGVAGVGEGEGNGAYLNFQLER